jgi:hypothetical protein
MISVGEAGRKYATPATEIKEVTNGVVDYYRPHRGFLDASLPSDHSE